ncbi:hypothetical protein PDIDSM_2687 [Penicillium digitatum]|nr:hypothetical protein PDIDSM_2687 [Penicillium digitatum]
MSLRNLAIFSVLGLVSALDKIGFDGPSALWPGMGTSGGDLIQALAVSFSDPAAWTMVHMGKYPSRNPAGWKAGSGQCCDEITMHYKYNDETGNFDQTVYINGEVVSTLSTNSGQAQGWGTAVECQDDACDSTTAAHADPSFGDTLAIEEVISSGLKDSRRRKDLDCV